MTVSPGVGTTDLPSNFGPLRPFSAIVLASALGVDGRLALLHADEPVLESSIVRPMRVAGGLQGRLLLGGHEDVEQDAVVLDALVLGGVVVLTTLSTASWFGTVTSTSFSNGIPSSAANAVPAPDNNNADAQHSAVSDLLPDHGQTLRLC